MAFTASHYLEVARIISDTKRTYGNGNALLSMQSQLAKMFARQNPRFDAERFNRDCEPVQAIEERRV